MKTSTLFVILFSLTSLVLFTTSCDESRDDDGDAGDSQSDTNNGDDTSGDTASGDTASGDTASGDTASGDTASGDTASGDTSSEDTASGDATDADADTDATTNPMGPRPVDLGTAGDYVILAKSGISTTGATAIVGDIALSPADSTYITGFGLSAPPTTFTTSDLITGRVWAADYDAPTPSVLTTAVSDMETAFTDAAGRTLPDFTELGAGNIDGMTLTPGLYKWGTGVSIPIAVTLAGDEQAVWIFQIAEDLTVGNGAIVNLSNGAQPENVFWQVAGQVTLGTTSSFQGIILSQTLIELNTGATLLGRALAQTAVTLDATAVTQP